MNAIETLLAEKGALILDGAMGTMLFAAGLTSGNSPEEWNVIHPERVQAVHQAYVSAGSDIILTNSFGGTRYRLKLHQFQERVLEFNRAAAQVARAVADAAPRKVLVAGSMGPTGELLEPMGSMTYAECVAAFAEQAQGLTEGGADLLWIETMSDLNEVRAAVEGAKSVSHLPICTTLSFDTHARTMMGVTGKQAVEVLAPLGVFAIGANCGNNLPDTEAVIAEMRSANPHITLISKANAGIPHWEGENLIYNGTPAVMGAYAHRVRGLGASLIGACCGSSPAHIRTIAQVLHGEIPVPDAPPPMTASESGGEKRERKNRIRN
ncbi:MAG TPA: betaine--homocysteine S-methyltransferase [Anaerolineales bacterium]|nr:betaine--homocysteine S-methyltransferase [Anaerolineales bacterium]